MKREALPEKWSLFSFRFRGGFVSTLNIYKAQCTGDRDEISLEHTCGITWPESKKVKKLLR